LKLESAPGSPEAVLEVAEAIVGQFTHLIEKQGLNKELFERDGSPRHEATAQRLFFAVASSYCRANNVDISPEIDTGTGAVDFKLSVGHDARVLVELKLSTNGKLIAGYEAQLEAYKEAQETEHAMYLIIDVGKMGKKLETLTERRNAGTRIAKRQSALRVVDARTKPSASKRKS
jgi:hypothetical protein